MIYITIDGRATEVQEKAQEGFFVMSARLTLERNKAGSLEFTLPAQNPVIPNIKRMKSKVVVSIITGGGTPKILFSGRVAETSRDFYNNLTCICEGTLAYMLDAPVRPYEFSGTVDEYVQMLVNQYNAQVEDDRKINYWRTTVEGNIYRASSDYPTTWQELTDKTVKLLGGYLNITYDIYGEPWLSYMRDEDATTSTQEIAYSINLLDFTEQIKTSDIYTQLIPLGAVERDEQGNIIGQVDITSVNDGVDFVKNDALIALFGKITKVKRWNDVTLPNNLLTKAQADINSVIEQSTFEFKAIDLNFAGQSRGFIEINNLVNVISPPHGINITMGVVRVEHDLLNPQNSIITVGGVQKTASDYLIEARRKE